MGVVALPWHSVSFGKRLSLLTHTPCSDAALERASAAGLAERCASNAPCLGLERRAVTRLPVRREEKGVKRWYNKSVLPWLYVTECVCEVPLLLM